MSFFRTIEPADASLYEGAASLSSIADAARDTALYADNFNAEEYAREEAFDEARKAVREATGIELDNPQWSKPASIPSPASIADPLFDKALGREDPFAAWDKRMGEIIAQHPDKAEVLTQFRLEGIQETALGKARAADERYQMLSSTRPGWRGFAAGLYGGLKGSFQDPLTLATLPFGFGAGSARTVAGKVLATTWREALVSGISEAAIQPVVQKWRADAGLPAGFEEGLKNVAGAALLGGLVGGGLRGALETPGAVRRSMSRRFDPRMNAPSVERVADDLIPHRDTLPPAARAAVDVFEQERAVTTAIRAELGDDLGSEFGRMMERADRFADRLQAGDPEEFRGFLRSQELTQDPELASRFDAAEKTMEETRQAVADLEAPLTNRGLADTLEQIDPDTAARVRDIDQELARDIPAKRRGDLEAERTRISESVGQDVLERTEREFRIGPEKQLKRAKQKARDARKAFNAVRREVDGKANARLEAGRVTNQGQRAAGEPARPGRAGAGEPVPVARPAEAEPFEPAGAEVQDQVAALESQINPEDDLADLLYVDQDGKITASGRTVAEALEEADRGHFLSNLVEACKLS